MLTNFDQMRPNICKVEPDILGLGTQATGLLSEIKETYNQLIKINSLFGELVDYKIFTSCIGSSEKFEDLLGVEIDRMTHCLSSVFFDDRNKRSSWLGWALGDGQQLDSISSSLKETINAYNTNFHNLEKLDSSIVVRYNEITSKMESLSEHEHLLRDLLIAVQIETQLQLKRQIYLNLKNQHLTAIREIIEKSDLHESIDLISGSIFHRNLCSVDACETDIYSTTSPGKIIVHREL